MLCDSPLHAYRSFWSIYACRCAHVWSGAKHSLTDPRWPWVVVLALRSVEAGAFLLAPDAWGAEFRPEAQGDGSVTSTDTHLWAMLPWGTLVRTAHVWVILQARRIYLTYSHDTARLLFHKSIYLLTLVLPSMLCYSVSVKSNCRSVILSSLWALMPIYWSICQTYKHRTSNNISNNSWILIKQSEAHVDELESKRER